MVMFRVRALSPACHEGEELPPWRACVPLASRLINNVQYVRESRS